MQAEDSVTILTKFTLQDEGKWEFDENFLTDVNRKYSKMVVSREDLENVIVYDRPVLYRNRDRNVSGTFSYALADEYLPGYTSSDKLIDLRSKPDHFMMFLRHLNEYEILISLQARACERGKRKRVFAGDFVNFVNFAESLINPGVKTGNRTEEHTERLEETAQEFASNYAEFRRKYYDQGALEDLDVAKEVTFQLLINAFMDYAGYDHVVTLRRMISLRERNRDDLIENGLRFKDYFTKLVPVPEDPKHRFLHRMLSEGVLDPLTVTAKTVGDVFLFAEECNIKTDENWTNPAYGFVSHLTEVVNSVRKEAARPVSGSEHQYRFPPMIDYRQSTCRMYWINLDFLSGLQGATSFFEKSCIVYVTGFRYPSKHYVTTFGDRQVIVKFHQSETIFDESSLTNEDIDLATERIGIEQQASVQNGRKEKQMRDIEVETKDRWIKDFVFVQGNQGQGDLLQLFAPYSHPIEQVKRVFIGTEFQKLIVVSPAFKTSSQLLDTPKLDELCKEAATRIAFNVCNDPAVIQRTMLIAVTIPESTVHLDTIKEFKLHIRSVRFPMKGMMWTVKPIFPHEVSMERALKELKPTDLRVILEFGSQAGEQTIKVEHYIWRVTLNDVDSSATVSAWTGNLRDALFEIINQL